MRRSVGVSAVIVLVVVAAGLAVAQMPGGQMGPGAGSGHMGPGMMGPGMMGGPCPGGAMAGGTAAAPQMTGDGAKLAAQQYADQYLKGFTVDKVLPMTGMHMTMYSVELVGPQGEVRVLHVNPWGAVMPFGGPWRRPA